MSEEHEYLKLEVTRTQSTEIYLMVPKGWRPTQKDRAMIGRAARITTYDYDWNNDPMEECVEWDECKPVSESAAAPYEVFDVAEHLAKSEAKNANNSFNSHGV